MATAPLALPRLRKMLSDTDDTNILDLFWGVYALQNDNVDGARRVIKFPPEAATADMMSRFAVHPWDIETVLTLNMNTPKASGFGRRPLPTDQFNAAGELINTLRTAQGQDTADRISAENIMLEMHRVSHRQFAWQRGWANKIDIFRYLYIYGQGNCADYFHQTYGLTISDFFGVALATFQMLSERPWVERIHGTEAVLGITDDAVERAYGLLSQEIWSGRRSAKALREKFETSLGAELPVIYYPSFLRVKPIVKVLTAHKDLYIAPLPQLIMLRATLGLFFDLVPGGTAITNDANARFEEYARRAIEGYCRAFEAAPTVKYTFNGNPVETPDILMKRNGVVQTVFECKATKLTFEAQYGDDPVQNAKNGYAQMAKAIFQLWKFFSHIRRGILTADVADDATGVVLTIEPWTQMSSELRGRLVQDANDLAAAKDPGITDVDKRRPVFCTIEELEDVIRQATEDQLLATFRAAMEDRFNGWSIREVRKEVVPEKIEMKPHPFDLANLLPWWDAVEEYGRNRPEAETS